MVPSKFAARTPVTPNNVRRCIGCAFYGTHVQLLREGLWRSAEKSFALVIQKI